MGAAVRTAAAWRATAAPPPPLVEFRDLGPAPARPTRRPRVLDLTRVIAGPVATRTLAAHGADVLRLDAPDRPEIPLQAYDTLPGKRSALLDLATGGDTLDELLAGADVVVTGYRPGALDRFGLAPEALAQRHPGLVVVTLSAWGHRGPWASRRGFDSLVQAACGIAATEGGPAEGGPAEGGPAEGGPAEGGPAEGGPAEGGPAEGNTARPGALPAQALDHVTGFLAAAGTLIALAAQRRDGGSRHVRLSLIGTAAWLQGLPCSRFDEVADVDPAPYLVRIGSPGGELTLAAPPGTVDGLPLAWPSPPPAFGAARARWAGPDR